ncbi:MAG: hypothetical protein QW220_02120 [Candidatus Bathyarchaeia archaeon]
MIRLQECLIKALYSLNAKSFSTPSSSEGLFELPTGELIMEIGVAEGYTFNYFDEVELEELLSLMKLRELQILDLLLVTCYYRTREGKKIPLRFDYHFLRFEFESGILKLSLYHDRGPRRVPFETLLHIIIGEINEKLEAESLPALDIKILHST